MRLPRWSSSNGAFVKCMLLGQGQEPKPACSYSKSWQLGSPFAHIGAVCSKNVNYSISGAENCSIRAKDEHKRSRSSSSKPTARRPIEAQEGRRATS